MSKKDFVVVVDIEQQFKIDLDHEEAQQQCITANKSMKHASREQAVIWDTTWK